VSVHHRDTENTEDCNKAFLSLLDEFALGTRCRRTRYRDAVKLDGLKLFSVFSVSPC